MTKMTKEEIINKLDDLKVYYTDESEIYVGFDDDDIEAIDFVINLLKKEPNDDCISRTETLNKMNELVAKYIPIMPVGWTLPLNISKMIIDMPPVEPKGVTITDFADRCRECGKIKSSIAQDWIPASERLPEIHQDVLLSLKGYEVGEGFRVEENQVDQYFYCHGVYIRSQDVLAWMPKPEPYKGESEGDE